MRETLPREIVDRFPPEYVLVAPDGRRASGDLEPIGSGGTSAVYRAVYRNRLPRAVKFMVPRADLARDLSVEAFAGSFENEITMLTALSHENIARLTDLGTVSGPKVPYVVTEYINGIALDVFCTAETTRGRDVLRALRGVLQGMAYMHGQGVMHCDLKPSNILVRTQQWGRRTVSAAVIIDLGGSRHLGEEGGDRPKYTYFFSTPEYVLPRLIPYLGNHSGNHIPYSELVAAFPRQDLYSFGRILHRLLSDDVVRDKLSAEVGRANLAALENISNRLGDVERPRSGGAGPGYKDAVDVLDAFSRVSFASVAPLGIPELAPMPERGVVLPTSRARVAGSDRVNAVIEHPLFQRLHNLPQLDLLHFVLPGATHTRFVHALHTYDLCRTAIGYQLSNWDFRLNVEAADIEYTLFSALLDSVGRFHFQHMFEDFVAARKQPIVKQAGLLNSRELLDAMMGTASGDLADALGQIRDTSGRTLGQVVEWCLGSGWPQLRAVQRNPQTPVQGFLSGLMSSPVDVDKLAYLIDDSAFTGLPFGHAVSPSPVFEAMRVPGFEDWSRQTSRIAVALREKALSYVESAVLSRYWNIQTGYWYRTNRSLQAMVKYQIGALLRSQSLTFPDFILGTLHYTADGALRWLDTAFNSAVQNGAIDESTVDPLAGIMESRRDIYKRLVTISPKSRLQSREKDRFVFEGLTRRPALEDNVICSRVAQVLEEVKPGLSIRPGEVLLDLPRVRREEIGGKLLVYADRPGAELIGELSAISPALAGLKEQFDLYAKRLRVFVHPRIARELESLQEEAHWAVLEMLRSEYDGEEG